MIAITCPKEEVKIYRKLYKKAGLKVKINPTGYSKEYYDMLNNKKRKKENIT